MMRRASVFCLGILAAGAAIQGVACTSDDSSTAPPADAGADRTTGGNQDSGGTTSTCSGPMPVMTARDPATNQQVAPDWSCYAPDASALIVYVTDPDAGDAGDDGAVDAETDAGDAGEDAATDGGDAGADAATDGGDASGGAQYKLHIIEFVTHQDVANASVDLFFGSSAAGTPDQTGTTDAKGVLTFSGPAGLPTVSYHATGTGLLPVYYYDIPVIPPGVQDGTTLGYSITLDDDKTLTSSILGSEPPNPSSGAVVTGLRDCQGREVRGATVEIYDGETAIQSSTTAGAPRLVYFNDTGIPDTRCTFTANGSQSLRAFLNVPPNMPGKTHAYSMRVFGRRTDADNAPVMLAQRPLEVWAGASTVGRAYPVSPPK